MKLKQIFSIFRTIPLEKLVVQMEIVHGQVSQISVLKDEVPNIH